MYEIPEQTKMRGNRVGVRKEEAHTSELSLDLGERTGRAYVVHPRQGGTARDGTFTSPPACNDLSANVRWGALVPFGSQAPFARVRLAAGVV